MSLCASKPTTRLNTYLGGGGACKAPTPKKKIAHNPVALHESFEIHREVSKGSPYEREFQVDIPVDAPPTVEGALVNIVWNLVSSIEAKVRDSRVEQEIVVLNPLHEKTQPRNVEVSEAYEQCNLSLTLTEDEFNIGTTLMGKLRATTWQTLEAQRVVLVLERSETSGVKSVAATLSQIVLQENVTLDSSGIYEWPFEVAIPNARIPSLERGIPHRRLDGYSVVQWKIRGLLYTGMLGVRIYRVEQVIKVGTN